MALSLAIHAKKEITPKFALMIRPETPEERVLTQAMPGLHRKVQHA
jgi:hypothetical protein